MCLFEKEMKPVLRGRQANKHTHTHTHTNTGSAMVVVVVDEVGSDVARHCQFKTDGSFVENGALCFT